MVISNILNIMVFLHGADRQKLVSSYPKLLGRAVVLCFIAGVFCLPEVRTLLITHTLTLWLIHDMEWLPVYCLVFFEGPKKLPTRGA